MRRKDKQITGLDEIESVLHNGTICRIALCEDNIPYIVSMNYGYKDNCLYFHSAKEGKKLDILKNNPNICFEVDIDVEIQKGGISCNWGMKYKSVIGLGKAHLIENDEEKKEALDIIMNHYSDNEVHEYNFNNIKNVAIIKVVINSITGKKSGY